MSTGSGPPRRRRSDADGPPWSGAVRVERRLQVAQAAILILLAAVVGIVAVVTGRGMVHELNDYRAEQNLQSRLDVLRYGLQEQEALYWRRRAGGEAGIAPEATVRILSAVTGTRALAEQERRSRSLPAEQAAIRDVLAGLDRLTRLATSPAASAPIGSPAGKRNVRRLSRVGQQLKDAATAWHSANAAELAAANDRVRSATRRLIVLTGGTALVAVLLGIGVWVMVSGSRRKLVGALQEAAVLLRHQADSDPLTGLANHRVLHERLREAVASARSEGRPLSVVVLDLDHFKRINDTFGHPVGDLVLRETALRARISARAHDLVARIGGEEFVLLLHDTDGAEAFRIAERLRAAIAAEDFPGDVGHVTASLGVASLRSAQNADGLLARADAALYAAKARGRDQTVRDSELPEIQVGAPDHPPTAPTVYSEAPRPAVEPGWPGGETPVT